MTIYPPIALNQPDEYLMTPLETKNTSQRTETEQLVEACLKGERASQMKVYQQYYNQIFAVCFRYANDRDQAKSLVNASFLKAFQSMGSFIYSGSLGGWINRIAINTCIDEIRKRNKMLKHTVSMDVVPDLAVSDTILDAMAAEDILAAIQQVTPVSRTVFCLYVIDGFKHAEIANMLNIQEGTSRWHLNNAKRELKILLKNYDNQ